MRMPPRPRSQPLATSVTTWRAILLALGVAFVLGVPMARGRRVEASSAPTDVTAYLAPRFALWDQSPRILGRRVEGHRWDAREQVLRASGPAVLGALPLTASILRFEGGRPVRWELWLYDRALQGWMPEAWIEARRQQAREALGAWAFGAEPMVLERPAGVPGLVWGRSPTILTLEGSTRVGSAGDAAVERVMIVAEPWPPRRDWSRLVRTAADGTRHLVVPMVEQRVQGLCAPATVERVMRYFGIPLAADTMARLADSSPQTGTDVRRMMQEISDLRGMGCDVRTLLGFDVRRYRRTLRAYNAAAQAAGDEPLEWSAPVLDLAQTFLRADGSRLRDVAARQRERRAFWRELQASIDRGIPLIWGVVLGLVPEPAIGPQTRGGHLRLIVGYDPVRRQVLYSDPWGEEHALKRLDLEDAWAMTMSLHVIVPSP